MEEKLPRAWAPLLREEASQPYFAALRDFVREERARHSVYPPEGEVFNALRLTPPDGVKAVILGQDPYHGEGQAHGLAFSVRAGVRPPPSLRNIFRELNSDLGCGPPEDGELVAWAKQGVLLLNSVLTVRQGEPNSHAGHGWERFSDAVIRAVNALPNRVVFLLWGAPANRKAALVSEPHQVVPAAHPSPLSARRGFLGSHPFSRANALLAEAGVEPVHWCLPAGDA